MTPPPGWVLEPHMYIPRTGARYWAYPGTGRLNYNWSNVSSPWKIFTSDSQTSFSISHGVRISAFRMRSLKLGLTRDIVSITVLPNAFRRSSFHSPSANLLGHY